MLHTLLAHSVNSQKNKTSLVADDIISQLNALQLGNLTQPLNSSQLAKLNFYLKEKTLRNYLEFADSLNKFADLDDCYLKLRNLFSGNDKKALQYLWDYKNKYPNEVDFITNACLCIPTDKNWIKLASQNNSRLLLDSELRNIFKETDKIEKQLKIDKNNLSFLQNNIYTKYNLENSEAVIKFIKKSITECSNFCRKYEVSREARLSAINNTNIYIENLKRLSQLRADLALFFISEPLKQWSSEQVRNYYQRVLLVNNDENIKQYFIMHGISEYNYKYFLSLARQNAGENIPSVTIDGASIGYTGFYLIKLDVQDQNQAALAACLGKKTNCCQSLSGESGQSCVIHGLTNPNGAFYVLFKGNINVPNIDNQVIAQAWVWKGNNGGIVFDSIEAAPQHEFISDKLIIIALFRELAFKLVYEHKIPFVNCGIRSGIREVGYYDISEIEENEMPILYNEYRDSAWQAMVAHQNFLCNTNKEFVDYKNIIIHEIMLHSSILTSKKILQTILILNNLKRFDILDNLIQLLEEYKIQDLDYTKKCIKCNKLFDEYEHKTISFEIFKNYLTTFLTNTESLNYLLSLVLYRADENIMQHLLDYGINNADYKIIHKHLSHFITAKNINLVNLILKAQNISLFSARDKFNLMLIAIETKNIDMINELMVLEPDLHLHNQYNETLLTMAATEADPILIEPFIDGSPNSAKSNALIKLAKYADKDKVIFFIQKLLESGADINARCTIGRDALTDHTVLEIAVMDGSLELVEFLLSYEKQKVNVNCLHNILLPPIFYALRNSSLHSVEILELLLKNGADITIIDSDNNKDNALFYLLKHQRVSFLSSSMYSMAVRKISVLLEYKPNLLSLDALGENAIHICARYDSRGELLKKLLNSNLIYNINASNSYHNSALDLAIKANSFTNIQLLIQHGADPNDIDLEHVTDFTIKNYLISAQSEWNKKGCLHKLSSQLQRLSIFTSSKQIFATTMEALSTFDLTSN